MNASSDFYLSVDALMAIVASLSSLYYFLRWKNGKKYLTLVSFATFFYLGVIHFLALFEVINPVTYGAIYVRPVLPLVYGIIIGYVYLDSKKNKLDEDKIHKAIGDLYK